jgi:hypothetical protein
MMTKKKKMQLCTKLHGECCWLRERERSAGVGESRKAAWRKGKSLPEVLNPWQNLQGKRMLHQSG